MSRVKRWTNKIIDFLGSVVEVIMDILNIIF